MDGCRRRGRRFRWSTRTGAGVWTRAAPRAAWPEPAPAARQRARLARRRGMPSPAAATLGGGWSQATGLAWSGASVWSRRTRNRPRPSVGWPGPGVRCCRGRRGHGSSVRKRSPCQRCRRRSSTVLPMRDRCTPRPVWGGPVASASTRSSAGGEARPWYVCGTKKVRPRRRTAGPRSRGTRI